MCVKIKSGSVWFSLSLGQVLMYVGLWLLHKPTLIRFQDIFLFVSYGSVLSALSNISFSPQLDCRFRFMCMCFFLAPSTQRKWQFNINVFQSRDLIDSTDSDACNTKKSILMAVYCELQSKCDFFCPHLHLIMYCLFSPMQLKPYFSVILVNAIVVYILSPQLHAIGMGF